jgi:hypothetical protein
VTGRFRPSEEDFELTGRNIMRMTRKARISVLLFVVAAFVTIGPIPVWAGAKS